MSQTSAERETVLMALQLVPRLSLGTANKKIETLPPKMKNQLPYFQNDISIIKERNNTLSRGIDTQSIIIFFLSICL